MWWFFFILFLLISLFSSISLFYALKRINQYENMLLDFEKIIKFSSEKMKLVDSKGHYESDDETSFFFDQLKQLQKSLDAIFVKEETE
jgi:hypothetical protein|tara:strand:- start:1637 stop:1900 length:264 start_codon:yes stop_codon:yes gene_type:complete